MQRLAEAGDRPSIELLASCPELPAELGYLLDLHRELVLGRQTGVGGGEMGWSDVADWLFLTDQRLEPHEVVALLRIDREFLNPPDDLEDDDDG